MRPTEKHACVKKNTNVTLNKEDAANSCKKILSIVQTPLSTRKTPDDDFLCYQQTCPVLQKIIYKLT